MNAVTANTVAAAVINTSEANTNTIPGFTAEQVQRILNLIDDKKLGNCQKAGQEKLASKIEWLYDTGASYHMTGTYEVLKNVKEIHPVIVGLLDGNSTIASKIGCVQLGPYMLLQGVLFVPKLKCIISI